MIINNDVLDLGFNAFNLTGINIIAEGAERLKHCNLSTVPKKDAQSQAP